MKFYHIVYQRLAQKDLVSIFDYIKVDNRLAAQKLLARFEHSIQRLENFPFSGIVPRDASLKSKGYRIVVVGEYLVFYRISGKSIQIKRVIQGRREYTFLL